MKGLEVGEVLGPGGIISDHLQGYEFRSAQVEMAHAVLEAFETDRPLLAEAGTGVGKSFAYLVPAILRAVQHGERVIISTDTLSLQEQLIRRDIPFLQEVLPFRFEAALAKGRGNFLCLRRLHLALQRQGDLLSGPAESEGLGRIAAWSRETGDGSRSDFDVEPDRDLWSQVAAERGNCMGRRSPHHKDCFYQRARARAEEADILVVNHHLLFSDLALRAVGARCLPDAGRLILDEAHSVERIAAEHLGGRLTRSGLIRLLRGIWNRKSSKGIARGRPGEREIASAVEEAEGAVDRLFDSLRALKGGEDPCRLRTPPAIDNPLGPALGRLHAAVARLVSEAENLEEETEARAAGDRIQETGTALDGLLRQGIPGQVYWLETSGRRGRNEEIRSAPVHVGEFLRERIFDRIGGVVLTSATLSVGGDDGFRFVRERLGVPDPREVALGSPFRYAEQVRIVIPGDLPDPSEGDAFLEAAAGKIRSYLEAGRGGAFVLFTSHSHLRRVREILDPFFRGRGIRCFTQGEGVPRAKMLDRFRDDIDSVLFGADSFWQGVDVPGEALTNVIIVKLPFQVPTRPLVEARLEEVEARDGNPFQEVTLPEAALRLKQGFGRLIRNQEDRGVVAILDPRIRRKRYGTFLLKALPECPILQEWPGVTEEARG